MFAVNYEVLEKYFHLIAITSIYISSKINDERPLSICEAESTLGKYQFKQRKILKMEKEIISKIGNL